MLILLSDLLEPFKDNLHRRLDASKQTKNDWIKHIYNIINKYISTEHSTIQIKPNEAGKKENHLCVNWHLQNKANSNRKYPNIKDGDMVRVHVKPKFGTKSHEPKLSSTGHKVVRIGNKYLIDYAKT